METLLAVLSGPATALLLGCVAVGVVGLFQVVRDLVDDLE